jgi:hypothetical protein
MYLPSSYGAKTKRVSIADAEAPPPRPRGIIAAKVPCLGGGHLGGNATRALVDGTAGRLCSVRLFAGSLHRHRLLRRANSRGPLTHRLQRGYYPPAGRGVSVIGPRSGVGSEPC